MRLRRACRRAAGTLGRSGRDGDRGVDRSSRELRALGDELEQRERVPRRRVVEALGDLRRDGADERRRRLAIEALDVQRREVGAVQQRGLPVANGEDGGERLGEQPPEGEQQRLRARAVEGVRVVHEQEHRRLLRVRGEEAECRRADREPLGTRARPQRESALESGCLRRRDPPEQAERGPQELEQAGERHVRFRVDAARAQELQPRSVLRRVLEQRRLADPRLADERQHGAAAGTRARQDAVELLPLSLTAEQHALDSRTP